MSNTVLCDVAPTMAFLISRIILALLPAVKSAAEVQSSAEQNVIIWSLNFDTATAILGLKYQINT